MSIHEMNPGVWTEKYRPREFPDVVGEEEIVSRVSEFVKNKNIPHMLFTGPAGCGKTTLSLLLVKKLFGEQWRENFLELNASDERGIDVIRHKVKDYARTVPLGNVPFKIVYLDEADALTPEAQQALRRTMENYARNVRFILSCNYSSRIIEPIQSRCVVFRFRRLPVDAVAAQLKRIARDEKVEIDSGAVDAICHIAEGDLRKAINMLQACAVTANGHITEKTVYEASSKAKPDDVKDMLELAIAGKFDASRSRLQQLLMEQGLSGGDVVTEIHRQAFELPLSEEAKLRLVEKVGEYEFRIAEGGSDAIQLEALLAQLALLGSEEKSRMQQKKLINPNVA